MTLEQRFLKYVAFDTQSDPKSETYPSTAKQLALLNHLLEEMTTLGLHDVEIDPNGYVTGTIPATPGCESAPVVGFISHVDTSPDMKGSDIRPGIIERYDGGDIALNDKLTMRAADFPELAFYKGHRLIVTDGTTLLGADDKAGIAEIMTAAEYLTTHPEAKHGTIRIGFTPDEEIGRGVDFFDVERFGAKFAYTMDGGFEGEIEYENFNAAAAEIAVQGRNIHPGYAKDKMINALQVACEINALLPAAQRPEHTEGYEGFYHLVGLEGTVERAGIHHPRPFAQKVQSEKTLSRRRRGAARREIRGRRHPPDAEGPVLQHARKNRTVSRSDRKGDGSDAAGRRRADRASDPRRHGRGEAIVHGPAVPEPVYRRHEFPRQIRVLFGRHDATSRANHYKPGPYLVRILTDAQPFVCRN